MLLLVLLAIGLVAATTVAVVQYVQLRAANERIEELEAAEPGPAAEEADDGGLFGEFGDLFDELLDEAEGLFGGADGFGSALECLGAQAPETEGDGGVGAIAAHVERIRQLEFREDVEPTFLGDAEMTARVRELFLHEYTPPLADLEERVLTALGAIPRDTDLRALRAEAIGQQVAGFYDPETGELVVRAGEELTALERITLAHELTHALTDQRLGIPIPDEVELGREDADLAALALVEGDATLVMQQYSMTLGLQEQLELLDPEAVAAAEAGLGDLPPYLEQELIFPYEEGLAFVCDLYAQGGWAAVDRAYRDPPTSTGEILFPERYLDGSEDPADPPDPRTPPGRWKQLARLQVGPAQLLWLFSAPGGDRDEALQGARETVGSWQGGEMTVWSRRGETALSIVLLEREPGVLCNAVREWYGRAFDDDAATNAVGTTRYDGPPQDAVLTCGNGRPAVDLVIAPSLAVARAAGTGT